MRTMSPPQLSVRVARSGLLLSRSVLAIIMVVSFAAAVRGNGWGLFGISSIIQVFLNLWLFFFALDVAAGVLSYRTLFRGWVRIRLEEINSVEIQIGERRYRDKFRPPLRLVVQPKSVSSIRPFDINLKVFRKEDIEILLEKLPVRREDGRRSGAIGCRSRRDGF